MTCAYQKLDLVESRVGDVWKTRAVRFNRTALVLFSQSRAVVDVPVAIVGCFGERRFGLVGGVWQSGSGRLPFVPVMKPADLRDRYDATIARRGDRARDRGVLVQRQVRA
jgi:hypothetical protein